MSCTACPLHEHALTVCVGGRGPEQAQILIVGQNPGREEDLAGEAFVGKSGKLLDGMLRDAGLDPSNVRITNAVRCVTPDNRVPMPAEIAACSPHLAEEIARTKPQAIIALGEVALKVLIGNKAISAARGQSFPLHPRWEYTCDVFVTYHPAYVLRSPMARATVVTDLRRCRDRGMEQTQQAWAPWTDGCTFSAPVLAYDIETYDADGKILEEMTQAAVSDGQTTFVSITRAREMLQAAKTSGAIIVSHNGWNFDDLKTGVASHYDTMAMAYLLDETQPLNLESLCVKYLGMRGWKEARQGAKLRTRELADYNARDAAYTIRLFHALREQLGDRIKLLDHIIRPARLALNGASRRGVWIDPSAVQAAKEKTQALLEQRREDVLSAVRATGFPENAFDKQLKTKVKHIAFNPNSNDHVGALLEWLGFHLPSTKQGKPSVDKETLVYIMHPVAEALLAYREVAKRMSTYILPYEEITQTGDGRAHPTFKVINTVTGRSSASGPNTQNLDRELKKFKNAPPGKVLVSADYAAVEFRMGAFIADERTIIDNYRRDPQWDPHTWFGARLYDKTEAEIKAEHVANTTGDSKRQIAKSANFSQEYLGTGETLRNYAAREMGIFLTHAESDRAHDAWHKAFPGWVPWYGRTKDFFLANGYVESLTGRRRNFGDISLLNRQQLQEALRELCNFQVQSFCFDIAAIALGACDRAGLPIVDFVHDDIKFEFDTLEQAEQAKPLIRRCMIDEPLRVLREVFGVVPTVPLEIEITVQENKQMQQLPSDQQKVQTVAA